MANGKFESIECESIIVKHPNGKGRIELASTENIVGMWITPNGNDGKMISIYGTNDQIAVGIYGKNKQNGVNICLSIDDKDDPYIQIVKPDGTVFNVAANDLQKIASGNARQKVEGMSFERGKKDGS